MDILLGSSVAIVLSFKYPLKLNSKFIMDALKKIMALDKISQYISDQYSVHFVSKQYHDLLVKHQERKAEESSKRRENEICTL